MNQNKFTQPHVRAKLARSGAVETVRATKDRTIAVEMADAGLVEELESDLVSAVSNPGEYFKNGTSGNLPYSVLFLLDSLPKKHPAAVKIRIIAKGVNELLDTGKSVIESAANALTPAQGAEYRTQGKISLILAQFPV